VFDMIVPFYDKHELAVRIALGAGHQCPFAEGVSP
jgi:hypothetical protein